MNSNITALKNKFISEVQKAKANFNAGITRLSNTKSVAQQITGNTVPNSSSKANNLRPNNGQGNVNVENVIKKAELAKQAENNAKKANTNREAQIALKAAENAAAAATAAAAKIPANVTPAVEAKVNAAVTAAVTAANNTKKIVENNEGKYGRFNNNLTKKNENNNEGKYGRFNNNIKKN